MTAVNDLLRFGLELAGIAALAVIGWHAGSPGALRFVLAVAAPVVLILVWAFLVAPKADNPLSPTIRMLLGSGLLLGAAVGLWLVDQREAGSAFVVLNLANTVLMLVLPA